MKYRVFALTVCLAVTAFTASAQISARGNLSLNGTVLTNDGRPVKDARIEIHEIVTGSLVTSGYSLPGGGFTFDNVPAGRYEIRAVLGLQDARERVDLEHPNQQVTLRISGPVAEPGSASATVSVAEMRIPEKAKKEFQKAQEAFAKHKLDEAREHCTKSLAVAPTYSRALALSALLNLSENKLEEAIKDGEQAIKSDYGYGMGYVVLAATYNAAKRYDDAVRTLEHGTSLTPNSWQAHFEMAKALLGKGEYQRALASADRAGQIAPPTYAPIHLIRAHALIGLKAYSDAMLELEKYIGDDPNGTNTADARKTLDQVKAFVATASK
jgi:tetratricopeptide (TPR) repeat protein